MKKQFLTLLVATLAIVQFGNAQDFGVKWNGYVKGEYIIDSRRSTTAREGQLMILPMPKVTDVNGKDLNAEASFNGYGIESRLKATITGPDAFGMKTAGVIEAHFFGAGGGPNSLGLRHAYFTLSDESIEILFGQYWHPNFVTNVSPGTHDFNAGLPFQSFNRSPQIRVSTKGKDFRFIGTLLTELDFKTKGGSARYAALPTLNAQLQFGDDSKFVGGVGVNVKTVDMNPRFSVDSDGNPELGLAEDKNKTSISFLGFAKANLGAATWKLWGQYGGNTTELLNIGGYALNNTGNDFVDAKVFTAWTEFSGKSGNMGWGIYAGYAMNGGFGEQISGVTALSNVTGGPIVESAYRISPRLDWTSGKVRFGIELGYTGAQYGGVDSSNGDIVTTGIDSVGNFRSLLSATYSF